jgi:pimeloyl-ACP methyl ester carboxylesterase
MTDRSAQPLLLLPGTLCDATSFAPLLLAAGLDGQFVRLAGQRSANGMARAVLAEAPPRFDLLGFSLGAIIALEIIALAPERVTRLALLGANPGPMPEDRAAGRRVLLDRARESGVRVFIEATWDLAVPSERRGDEAFRDRLIAMAGRVGLDAFDDQTAMTIERADSRPRLAEISVPTLVATGAEDRICPPQMSRAIADAIPGAELLIVPEAGHYAPLERPEILAEAVARWRHRPLPTSNRFTKELT